MEFNEYWTKEVNDQYRQMMKEHKSMDEIREFFGRDLMDKHPNNKFATGSLMPILKRMKYFHEFHINEIIIIPKEIEYTFKYHSSKVYQYKTDYVLEFSIGENNYVMIFYYYKCKGIDSLNLFFTTKETYRKYTDKYAEIYKNKNVGDQLTDEEHKELSNIAEEETKFNEPLKVMKALSFIIPDFYNRVIKMRLYDIRLSITETDRSTKIDMYRNIIKDSFTNVKESEDVDEDGKKIYYYKIYDK